jgi:hypothetical protein
MIKPQTTDAQKPNVKAFFLTAKCHFYSVAQMSRKTLINFIIWRRIFFFPKYILIGSPNLIGDVKSVRNYWSMETERQAEGRRQGETDKRSETEGRRQGETETDKRTETGWDKDRGTEIGTQTETERGSGRDSELETDSGTETGKERDRQMNEDRNTEKEGRERESLVFKDALIS